MSPVNFFIIIIVVIIIGQENTAWQFSGLFFFLIPKAIISIIFNVMESLPKLYVKIKNCKIIYAALIQFWNKISIATRL